VKDSGNLWALIVFYVVIFIQFFTDIPIIGYFFIVVFLFILITIFILKFNINFSFNNNLLTKEQINKIKIELNINDKQWKTIPKTKHIELLDYIRRQDRVFFWLGSIEKNNKRTKTSLESTNLCTIKSEWNKLTLDERINLINMNEKKMNDINKRKEKYENKKMLKEKEIQEKREYEIKQEEKQKELKKQEEETKKAEELKILQQKHKEENERLEQIKKENLIKEKREKYERDYKEKIKRDILEKERKIELESQAIQELINLGQLSDNYSSQTNRVPIPSHIKETVWKRDKQKCVLCNKQENLEFDHIIPISKGGSNSLNNLQLLCITCNRKKSNKIM
jgi:hypothetical protein